MNRPRDETAVEMNILLIHFFSWFYGKYVNFGGDAEFSVSFLQARKFRPAAADEIFAIEPSRRRVRALEGRCLRLPRNHVLKCAAPRARSWEKQLFPAGKFAVTLC